MSDRIALLVNPTAGRGAGATTGIRALELLRRAGQDVVDASGRSAVEARDRAEQAIADGARTLVVVGGDGMVHLGTNLCAGRPVRLGVVAAGTGNDYARNLGLPIGDVPAAVRVVVSGATRQVDAGRITDSTGAQRWFSGVLGAGFDAFVAARADRLRWPRGRARYTLSILLELPVFRPIPYRIELDGHRFETRAMLVAVATTSSFGGGMQVCPDADCTDGLFDVLVVGELSITAFLRVFPKVFSGTHVGHPAVQIRRARHVRLEADRVPAQADGELVPGLPLDVETVPRALEVLVPGGGRVGEQT